MLDLINQDNGSALVPGSVTFGTPTINNGGVRNTSITITAAPGSDYSGSIGFIYNRADVGLIPNGRPTEFAVGTVDHLSDFIDKINYEYDINITSADYVDVAVPPFEGTENETIEVTLETTPGSLVFFGNLVLTIRSLGMFLGDSVTNNTLNGFEPA